MLFEIDDGYNIPTKRGFIIRPVTPAQVSDLSAITRDFGIQERAAAFYLLAKRSVVVGRIPEADEDAVHEILTTYTIDMQLNDERNLSQGVGLAMKHPHLAKTSCDQCQKWSYSPITGKTLMDPDTLQPLLRDIKNEPVPCDTYSLALKGGAGRVMPPPCPKGHWSHPIELSDRNQKAFDHWKSVVTYGGFPNDATWLRNAQIIERACDGVISEATLRQRLSGPITGGAMWVTWNNMTSTSTYAGD